MNSLSIIFFIREYVRYDYNYVGKLYAILTDSRSSKPDNKFHKTSIYLNYYL